MSRDVVIGELIQQETRQLKMPGAARAFEALARQARQEKWSFEDYLHEDLSVEITSRRDSAVLRAMWRISREEAIGEIVEREFDIAGYREGQEIAQTEWDQMWGRIAHQVAALGLPGAPISLSRPIANVEEFEKIGRALRRRATGPRSTSGDKEP